MTYNKHIVNRIASIILADEYRYVYDPEHRNRPRDGEFFETDRGWSNDPKDNPNKGNTDYPYKLTPLDNEYFDAIRNNDMNSLQRMVGERAKEAGYKIKAYHGTKSDFSEFDPSKIKSFNEGTGFYFSEKSDIASGYGNVKSVFLNLNKPLPYDTKAFSKSTISKIIMEMVNLESKQEGIDIADGFLSNYGDVRDYGLRYVLNDASESLSNEEKANDQLSGIFNSGVSHDIVAKAVNKITGYDGYTSKGYSNLGDDMIYIAWFPNQIKSKDAIVKDNNGNIIPLSQRFNPKSNDIRF
jgi:hypothetical protein